MTRLFLRGNSPRFGHGFIWFDQVSRGRPELEQLTLSTRTLVRADTLGSDFDTALELWSYSGGNFTFISCNDNPWPSVNAKIEQTLDPGTYYLRIGGANQTSGVIKLKVGTFAIPDHDLFSGARQITSLPYSDPFDVSTHAVGTESGEPDPYSTKSYCGHNWDTVWYKYTPSASTLLTADIYGTQGVLFNTVIAVYKQTGSSFSSLQLVDCNSDNHNFGNGLQSSVAVNAELGQTYYFQVGGYWGATGSLRFRLQSGTVLGNDNLLEATPIPSCQL